MVIKTRDLKVGRHIGKGKEEELLEDCNVNLGHFIATTDLEPLIPEDIIPWKYKWESEKISEALFNILVSESGVTDMDDRNLILAIQNISTLELPIKTREMVLYLKKQLLKCYNKKPSVSVVENLIADYFSMSLEELKVKTHKHDVVKPRQVAMFFISGMWLLTLVETWKRFWGKDHATVLHAKKIINGYLDTDWGEVNKRVEDIIGKMRKRWLFNINFFKEDKYWTRRNIERFIL